MKRSLFFVFFGIALAFCAMTTAAQAQATRTWVSGVGDDANPCSRTAPCKTFAGAISKTAAGGEIDALDPGGFGTLTITKAITIDGGGGQVAAVLAASTVGFTVNAGANDKVVLRNLRINGISQSTSPGTNGINFVNALSLTVETTVIENFNNVGINFQPAARGTLNVISSIIDNCTNGGIIASTAATTGGLNRITISHSVIQGGGGNGVTVGANSKAELTDATIARNGVNGTGDYAVFASSSTAEINIDNSIIAHNTAGGGIHVVSGATVRVSNTSITDNVGPGLTADAGGNLLTAGNNRNYGNTSPGAFTGTAPLS